MHKIKNFLYLDDYKMYSISSQIFEGMTEYVIKSSQEGMQEETQQKGQIGSGRIMADIIDRQKNETEKKFLHDYSYKLFEDRLIENNKVLKITAANIEESIKKISDYSFIHVTGRIVFNDTKHIEHVMRSFNELGGALTYLTQKDEISKAKEQVSAELNKIKDRNLKSKAEQAFKSKGMLKEHAKALGLYYDEESLNNLIYVLNYGYNQQFEVQMPISIESDLLLFSAILQRDKLKENEISIIKKHSRISEKEFTIFGLLTQVKNKKDELKLYKETDDTATEGENKIDMKGAIMNLISHITNLEQLFVGKLEYEYVIDPIAVYQEL